MSRDPGAILHVARSCPRLPCARANRCEAAQLTRDLVHVVVAATTDEKRVRRPAGRALFDHLACLEAGRRAFPGLDDAAAACALDCDDVHWPSVTHSGAIVWPVVRQCGGHARAAAAGYEVTVRLGLAFGPEHRLYWHTSATAGTVGAAVAAALAPGLNEDRVADAAGQPPRSPEDRSSRSSSGAARACSTAHTRLAPVESAEHVEVQVPSATAALAALADPQTDEDAWWSTQYAVAVTLLELLA